MGSSSAGAATASATSAASEPMSEAAGVAMLATVDGGGPLKHESTPTSPKAPGSSPSMLKCVWMPTRPPGGTGDGKRGILVVVTSRASSSSSSCHGWHSFSASPCS
eukprot:jgi/Chrpa1/12963/Chrysochromulina_OHIO_Genome00018844-RA